MYGESVTNLSLTDEYENTDKLVTSLLYLMANSKRPVRNTSAYNRRKRRCTVFLKQFDNQRIINSMRIEKGEFTMKGTLPDIPQHLWLCTTIDDEFYYCDLLIDRDTLFIKGDLSDFRTDYISKEPPPTWICRLSGKHPRPEYKIDSLSTVSMFCTTLVPPARKG